MKSWIDNNDIKKTGQLGSLLAFALVIILAGGCADVLQHQPVPDGGNVVISDGEPGSELVAPAQGITFNTIVVLEQDHRDQTKSTWKGKLEIYEKPINKNPVLMKSYIEAYKDEKDPKKKIIRVKTNTNAVRVELLRERVIASLQSAGGGGGKQPSRLHYQKMTRNWMQKQRSPIRRKKKIAAQDRHNLTNLLFLA